MDIEGAACNEARVGGEGAAASFGASDLPPFAPPWLPSLRPGSLPSVLPSFLSSFLVHPWSSLLIFLVSCWDSRLRCCCCCCCHRTRLAIPSYDAVLLTLCAFVLVLLRRPCAVLLRFARGGLCAAASWPGSCSSSVLTVPEPARALVLLSLLRYFTIIAE